MISHNKARFLDKGGVIQRIYREGLWCSGYWETNNTAAMPVIVWGKGESSSNILENHFNKDSFSSFTKLFLFYPYS